MSPSRLNLHHLHYFWAVARDGNLTRTAAALRVSQSALSAQIRLLEEQLGEPLFNRTGRRLELSEAGHLALGYADDIFAASGDLLAALTKRDRDGIFRVGAVATLSRNFQESCIKPLLDQPGVRLRVESGRLEDLLERLADHALDIILTNRPVRREAGRPWRCRRLARQPVSIVGHPRTRRLRFPDGLRGEPTRMILPGPNSAIRVEFDALCEQLGLTIDPIAEVDDMATMRLLARDIDALALIPSVVVREELRSGALRELCVVPGLFESFYAVTVERRYQHTLVRSLLARGEQEFLAMDDDPT